MVFDEGNGPLLLAMESDMAGINLNKAIAVAELEGDIVERWSTLRTAFGSVGIDVDTVISVYVMPETSKSPQRFDCSVRMNGVAQWESDDEAANLAAHAARLAFDTAIAVRNLKAKAKAKLIADAEKLNTAKGSTDTVERGKRSISSLL
jgi:hypothetical protein